MVFLLLFAVAEAIFYLFKPKAEYTRKFVHVLSGLITMLFPLYLHSHWSVLVACILFILLLGLSSKFNFLRSIHGVELKSWGSVTYPVAVYTSYLAYYLSGSVVFFYQPMLIMALADPAAALAGRSFKTKLYKNGEDKKSIGGSAAFFMVAFALSLFIFYNRSIFGDAYIWLSLVSALITTLTEALSRKGIDNLAIPVSAILVLLFWQKLHA